jgi:hypothetical protein
MESFLVAVNAVVPFLVYISLGFFVKRVGLVDEGFMGRLNQVVFRVFFPFLMFNNMYQINPDFVLNIRVLVLGTGLLMGQILALFLVVPRIIRGNPQRGVVIQAIYRSNFVLFAIPLTENVFGEGSTTLASMMVALIIPVYNVVAVFVLEYFRGGKMRLPVVLKNVCTNPLILGALTGLAFFLLRIHLPVCLEKPIAQFGGMTTPLALFVLGGTLHFSRIRGNAKYLVPALGLKMVLFPVAVLALGLWAGFTPVERFVLFTMFATPVAASSYPMAQNMGGDGELAGEFVVVSTVASIFTIFGWVFALRNFGLI